MKHSTLSKVETFHDISAGCNVSHVSSISVVSSGLACCRGGGDTDCHRVVGDTRRPDYLNVDFLAQSGYSRLENCAIENIPKKYQKVCKKWSNTCSNSYKLVQMQKISSLLI